MEVSCLRSTSKGCDLCRVMFTVLLTYSDGKKHEVQLYADSRGKKNFEVTYAANGSVDDVSEPYEKRCTCTG